MDTKLKNYPRSFKTGLNNSIEIQDWGKLHLEANEMISLVNDTGKEYDIVAKEWGFYATPSINGRLSNEGFKTALVKNTFNKFYIMIVDKEKLENFHKYLKHDKQKLIEWLDERE